MEVFMKKLLMLLATMYILTDSTKLHGMNRYAVESEMGNYTFYIESTNNIDHKALGGFKKINSIPEEKGSPKLCYTSLISKEALLIPARSRLSASDIASANGYYVDLTFFSNPENTKFCWKKDYEQFMCIYTIMDSENARDFVITVYPVESEKIVEGEKAIITAPRMFLKKTMDKQEDSTDAISKLFERYYSDYTKKITLSESTDILKDAQNNLAELLEKKATENSNELKKISDLNKKKEEDEKYKKSFIFKVKKQLSALIELPKKPYFWLAAIQVGTLACVALIAKKMYSK